MQLDDHANALAAGLVAEAGDADDALLVVGFGDRLFDARGRHLEGDFRNEDPMPSLFLDDLGLAAHGDRTASALICGADSFDAQQDAAGRKVGPAHDIANRIVVRFRIFDELDDRVADFGDVVRWNVGRHADRDAARAVDEELRQARRKHDRLGPLAVEVRDEIDRLFVDVDQHLHGDPRQARLGIPIGCRRIPVDRAEVAVRIDQRIA